MITLLNSGNKHIYATGTIIKEDEINTDTLKRLLSSPCEYELFSTTQSLLIISHKSSDPPINIINAISTQISDWFSYNLRELFWAYLSDPTIPDGIVKISFVASGINGRYTADTPNRSKNENGLFPLTPASTIKKNDLINDLKKIKNSLQSTSIEEKKWSSTRHIAPPYLNSENAQGASSKAPDNPFFKNNIDVD